MKKLLATLLAAVLLAAPALAAGEPEQNYFGANEISIFQETPEALTLQYIRWAKADPSLYQLCQGSFRVDSCTVEPAQAEGYQVVTLKTTAELEQFLDSETGTAYNWVVWTYGAYDYYTGEQFNRRDTVGSAVNEYTKNIVYNGREFPMTYTQTSDWAYGSWEYGADGNATASAVCRETWTFTVPTGYNGLVYGLFSTPEVPELDPDKLSTEVSYAKKDVKSPQYFRFGHIETQEQPDSEKLDVAIHFNDEGIGLDNGTGYYYTLTNRTDAPVRRYAALLTYQPQRRWEQKWDPVQRSLVDDKSARELFRGQIHAVDIDLGPGESADGALVSNFNGISRMSTLWLEFDSLAERDRFLADSIFSEISTDDIQGYRTINEIAGSGWMLDTFGITIAPAK